MHELSIALNIVNIVEESAKENNAKKINKIELEIGEFSGVVIEALELALDSIVDNSILENAKIIFNKKKGVAICKKCKIKYSPGDIFSECPKCKSIEIEIIQGKELRVKSIEID